MSRMSGLGVYFVLIFLAIVLFASGAHLMGYTGAVPDERVDTRNVADSKTTAGYSSYLSGADAERFYLRSFLDSKGATYVEDEVIDEFSENDVVRVIISFRYDVEDFSLNGEVFEKKRELGNSFSGELKKTGLFKIIDLFGDRIESIQLDHEFVSMFDRAALKIGANIAWDSGLTGNGQAVCVIDSGIDYNHKFLSEQYMGGYDFVNNDDDPMDDYGHGTYVSGIIANIAPGAKIIAAKALGSDGKGYESDIIAAIDYCVKNKDFYDISVIAMSLSGGSFEGYCDSALVTKEANFASEQGIFVVAASGNGGSNNLTAPACGSRVTSVGATTITDSVPCSANTNHLLDLLAPGVQIKSARLGGGFEEASGTSASTAVVAGAALLVLEKENLQPAELEYRFRSTGFLIEHKGMVFPRVDLRNALNNVITNIPDEQIGEQSEGNWEIYGPALPLCECNTANDCAPGMYCYEEECTGLEYFLGTCDACLNDGDPCVDEFDPACNECNDPMICQWE